MSNWEHKFEADVPLAKTQEKLDLCGKEGWRLVTAIKVNIYTPGNYPNPGYDLFFKRRVK